jgi:hypothetical protein
LLAPVVRPAARGVLKGGIRVYEKTKESVAEFGELVDDLVAEVQEELRESRSLRAGLVDSAKKAAGDDTGSN